MKKLHTINLVTNFKTKKITPGPFGNGTSNFNNILFLFEIESVFRVVWVEGTKSLKYLFKKVFFESMFHFVILSYVLGKNVLPVLAIWGMLHGTRLIERRRLMDRTPHEANFLIRYFELQPWTKYLWQAPVFMWNSARQEKFHFYFSRGFC